MTAQIGRNAAALRNLAARLEHLGYTGDPHTEAERIAVNLLADGYRPIDRTPAARPARIATDDERRAHLTTIRAAITSTRTHRKATTP